MGTNTGLGIGIGIPFKNNALGGDRPYLPPELKARLIGVWDNYGKKNTDADRNIIKNKIPNAGGDLEILNAAYKLNSGFGEYKEDFTSWRIYPNIEVTDNVIITNGNFNSTWFIYKHSSESKINGMNIKVSGIPKGGKILYFYISDETANLPISYTIPKDGIYHLPESKINNNRASVGFTVESSYDWNNIRIEQIPSFEGAFVTDGINDLITSTKTVQEMLGGSNEITVVSMIHGIGSKNAYTNVLRESGSNYIRNTSTADGKTGIYGYTSKDTTKSIITDILGDKNDYKLEHIQTSTPSTINSVFSVAGWRDNSGSMVVYPIAWYWTIIANKVLTTDQINQVIAYFNLDRTLKPDILCNTIKQGITNENHAEFGDKLIDFSGNGRDIQLNNIAWDGDSGIGKYNYPNWKVNVTRGNKYARIVYYDSINGTYSADFKGITDLYKSYGLSVEIRVNRANTIDYHSIKEDGIYTVTPPDDTTSIDIRFGGENVYNASCDITITQIPSHAGALCLDGVNDFGKVTGMPIYKDYTFIIDRKFLNETFANQVCLVSKSKVASEIENGGAFIVDNISVNSIINPYSFYKTTSLPGLNTFDRQIVFQSKYKYLDKDIAAGTATDSDTLWLGTFRDNDSRFANVAIYSLMSFPYSMSEFLIERQLKKHKLGTLYPDMVEFRPVINSNVLLDSKPTFVIRGTSTHLNAGDYIPENSEIWVVITMNNAADRITKFVINGNTIDIPSSAYNPSTMKYGFPFTIDNKSPQKITITIEQDENYVKFEPIITSNVEYKNALYYTVTNGVWTRIHSGNYINIEERIAIAIFPNGIDKLVSATSSDLNNISTITINNSGEFYYFLANLTSNSPQNIDITIDEYIRYEDIVQPYPVLLRFNDENGNEVSWGGKFRVGSTITRIGSISDPESNLLNGLYSVSGLSLNGKAVTSSTSIVEKQMVFRTTATWLLDNNEPKVILSPRLLSIPNSSYKILGHIPDISGHGNHGVIHNSAYTGMSGANGYPYDYNKSSFWADSSLAKVVSGELVEYFAVKNSTGFSNITSGVYKGKIKVTGVTKAISENKISRLRIYSNSTTDNELIEIRQDGNYNIDIKGVGDANRVFFYAIPNNSNESIIVRLTEPIRIEQVGEYEGAYCLDGVDDFVTIPTTVGGKQVLMKVNWNTINSIIYDQRTNGGFAIFNSDFDTNENKVPAYRARNIGGSTYIDGILNKYIYASELKNITHNIVELHDPKLNTGTLNPKIGSSFLNSNYTQMSLYDFMLFDEISTDDKIKELNEYVGIEGNTEWRKTK
jgi:hypothetical protein